MFSKIISENKIPPNFLNSILTNNALYSMFKDDFDKNADYFQNRSKEEYIEAMLKFIEDKLFSKNIFCINDADNIEKVIESSKVINYIRKFYDDFLLEEIKKGCENLFKVSFFKGLKFTLDHDEYAKANKDFLELYKYIFKESIDYEKVSNEVINPIKNKLYSAEKLSLTEFDILCNYVKNNINRFIDMDIVTNMIKNHAYKRNHIFDREVVKELIRSTARDYFKEYNIECDIEFGHLNLGLKSSSYHTINPNIIYIDNFLIDTFISGNYVELFNTLFYEMSIIKQANLLIKNEVNYETFTVIMNLINEKVDLDKIFIDEDYKPYNFYTDLKALSFVKTLRFYQMLGVDLFSNYVQNKIKNIDEITEKDYIVPKKEISLEMIFQNRFIKLGEEKTKELLGRYKVLSLFYNSNGSKKRTIDIIKKSINPEYRDVITIYIQSSIIAPEVMIEDVNDLIGYKSKCKEVNELVERVLKYIYVDTFYYSLHSYVKLNLNKTNFDINEYFDDLIVKINCIKDIPLSHKFIDEALFVIEDAKQNY